ncbi:hypothetical protein [Autumnicola musiva]|uniref:Nucleoside 2-deoxyribosyltransferase n=1 Tax=Autumnicola musiva TaxID=3075589 RepID=A0ABU3DBC1_9FLAO|nr:hypothetical protein [Zunongwangia sp. F117]MDT0678827.1 hypothetical protein [Zunongwangia sp. F117]
MAEKKCFIITPIGKNDSQIRRSTDGLINTVLRPILENEFKFDSVVAAHEINSSGSINNQIMKRIIYDDLVIANLTGVNSNVMYEVAVRHSSLKPIIHICEEGTQLPFDIIDQRTIFYKNDMLGVKELRLSLNLMIKEAIKDKTFKDNPVYNAAQSKVLTESISQNPEKNFEKYLLERFESLESKIMGIKTSSRMKKSQRSEPFKLKIFTNEKIDEGLFYTELKSRIYSQNVELSFFKLQYSKKLEDRYETLIDLVIDGETYPPTTTEVKNALKDIPFIDIIDIAIEGNELPF